ncbi:hypothetical protein QN382_19085 [Pseudomonas sp. 10B1]|uniref:hypothetical protein n=1 Tax=unclassified Pseudomonas TaxID=196821 RepID=UPI002B229C0C|nr:MULTISPECIES: hypothetical protein [unclassified Pseudomonas]MEA9994297.1 hypothetical protein [Pseudomonas sp. AA4]MEB0088526.1 hypothetical protein [Pseudomonas sp. RTI1]MEB0126551.1 hypothetical protein [Pseudomonas sp. CCC1.2]MEB0154636.1 hypothetical protein [Pseudomonas sp. CCC4.3]MEB0221147.1 hypothetical protein [Pseudomonas sp. AB12(2023)]
MTRATTTNACLGNAAATMEATGQFVWAVGSLLQRLADSGDEEGIMSQSVIAGLGHGLRLVSVRLQEDAEHYLERAQSAAKPATQNAESENVSANAAVAK